MPSLENPTPKLYEPHKLSTSEQAYRRQQEYDVEHEDGIDALEVFELIRYLNDPEYPLTLEQLNVVNF